MNIHATRAVALTLDVAPPIAPLFLPLLDLVAGEQILPSQCTLTVTGTPSPLEVAGMLCAPGTVLGAPGDAVIQEGEIFAVVAGQPFALTGSVAPLEAGGVFGLSVPVQTLTTGAKVAGTIATVR